MNITTINLWGNYGPFRDRFEFFLEELASLNPDLLCLQEIKDDSLLQSVKNILAAKNILFDHESGLAIISRFPFSKTRILKYEATSPTEAEPRKILVTEIARSSREKITLSNTHLSWKMEDEPIRLRQIDELLAALNDTGGPVLMTGDFNDVPESKPIASVRNAGYQNLLELSHPEGSNITWDNQNPFIKTHSVKFPDRQVDFLFANQKFLKTHPLKNCEIAFNCPNVKGIYPSDHYGIFART